MWRLLHLYDVILNARHVLTGYDLKANQGKVALIAVANKLIRQAFAIVTQEKLYVDGFKPEKP